MQKPPYITERLQEKLNEIQNYSVTVVEAAAGFGKTTAIKTALKDKENTHFYTAVLQNPVVNYRRLCERIREFDPETAHKLTELGLPNRSNLDEIISLIHYLSADKPCYFVMDNLHLIRRDFGSLFFEAFLHHASEHLHVILITQYLGNRRNHYMTDPYINCILQEDLIMNEQDILHYFELRGVYLEEAEATQVFETTSGWPLAITLLREEVLLYGILRDDANLDGLLNDVFWSKLGDEAQSIYLRLSLFDSLTLPETRILLEREDFDERMKYVFSRTPMVQYNETKQTYYLREIMSRFLKKKLTLLPLEQLQQIYRNSGRLFRHRGQEIQAIACFYEVKDYEAILSSKLKLLEFTYINDVPFYQIAKEIVQECPLELKQRYPIAMLHLAYYLYNSLDFEPFDHVMGELENIIWKSGNDQLKGEWHLMEALYYYPYADRMTESYRKASKLMTTDSLVFTEDLPFLFAVPTIWSAFYTKAGEADEIGNQLSRMVKLFGSLTGGQGIGADVLYRGEVAYLRGDMRTASIYAYQARELAERHRQVAILFGVAYLLGQIAISRSDEAGLLEAIRYLDTKASGYSFMQGSDTNTELKSLVNDMLLTMVGHGDIIKERSYMASTKTDRMPLALLSRVHVFIVLNILNGEYEESLGMMEALEQQGWPYFSLSSQTLIYPERCVAYLGMEDWNKAVEMLKKTFQLMTKDGLIELISIYQDHMGPLFNDPMLKQEYGDVIEILIQRKKESATDETEFVNYVEKSGMEQLTRRETQIVQLAVDRLSNKEIAEELHISVHTVKNHMSAVFEKTDVKRRSQLARILKPEDSYMMSEELVE